MIKRRGFTLILISLVMALLAAWVARAWVQARLKADRVPPVAEMRVVVAATEIPFGTKVEARHVKTITLPRASQLGNHFENPDAVVGLIAVQRVISGEILLKEQFSEHASGTALAAVLKPNMRAVTVRVDDVVGVAGFLLPGNHVDVVAARLINNTQRAETETVLRNLNVLAVDQSASQDKDQPVLVRAVTLEVTPQQAEVLVRAREEGKIQLTLRNPLENNRTPEAAPSRPAQPRVVVRKVRSAPVRPAGNEVTIIRGTNVHNGGAST